MVAGLFYLSWTTQIPPSPAISITVEVSQTLLSPKERILLGPDLASHNKSKEIMEVLPPKGNVFFLQRAFDGTEDHRLLGVTVPMNTNPFVALNSMLGEGNHVGWDNSFYFSPGVDKTKVIAAFLRKISECCIYNSSYLCHRTAGNDGCLKAGSTPSLLIGLSSWGDVHCRLD